MTSTRCCRTRLAIHPPMLYMGYVGFSMAFSFAVAALIEGRSTPPGRAGCGPGPLAAWVFLTAGIALGSWWAYYELGWGGWWFWDPVENASLMPWLVGTALLHSAGRGRESATPSRAGRCCWRSRLLAFACSAPSWCAPAC
jgi:cytochrome c biogenesis factor